MAYTKQTWADLPSKTTPINASRLGHIEDGIYDAANVADTANAGLADKVDKVEGKGLSTNDYDDTAKGIVNAVTTNLSTKVDKSDVARVENGTSPSATINSGEEFYHLNVLYTATQDIATTDTITPNTNCRVSDSVTGQIKAVDETKADNSVIAPVENGTTVSQAYAVGSHAIRNGAFITWKNAKAQGETINDASDYTSGDVAGCLIKQGTFSGTTSELGAIVIYNSNDRVILSVEVLGNATSLYKRSIGYGSIIRTLQGETLINTAVSGTYYYI